MASLYNWGMNPFQDYLFGLILSDINISDKKNKNDINSTFHYILEGVLENDDEVVFLDYEISKKDNYFKVTGKNIVSALWLSGVFPYDTETILDKNVFVADNVKYQFNRKTKELSIKPIKN